MNKATCILPANAGKKSYAVYNEESPDDWVQEDT
jgi:hypothetical protein